MRHLAILAAILFAFEFDHSASAQTNASSKEGNGDQASLATTETTETVNPQQPSTPVVKANSTPKKLGFRLKDWKTFHASSIEDAQTTIATLKKIGCEVESDSHGDHIDVKYRCPDWRSMKLTTDQLINQWTTWCAGKGMETVVMGPPKNTQKPTVAFRMQVERHVHLHDEEKARQILITLKLIGCQVASHQHGDHLDVNFSCPDWITIELPNEDSAHGWQDWLDDSGFETQHTH